MTTTRTWHCQIILQKSPNVRGNGPANNKSNTYVHVRKTYELIRRHKHVFQFRWTSYVHIWALVQFTAIISDRLYSHSRHSLSRSQRDSEILRDISTWTYQICKVGEKINWTITFHKWICNLMPDDKRYIENIVEKRRRSHFSSFPKYFITYY